MGLSILVLLSPGLAALGDVVFTPHLGSASFPAREAKGWLVAESILAALAGRTPDNLVEGT